MESHAASARVGVATPSAALPAVRSALLWLAGLTAAGLAVRFATLGLQSYHHDEVITAARVLPGSFGHMLHEVRVSESTPPLYYAVAWAWGKLFGLGEAQLRSLSALVGTMAIPVAFLIGRELAGRRAGLIAAALIAVNPMLVWYSQEARAYSLLVLFCALSLLFFLRVLRRGSWPDVILWSAWSGLALATHYFAVFPIAIEVGWLVVAPGRGRRTAALAGASLIALAGIALAPLMLHQASLQHTAWIARFSLASRLWDTIVAFGIGETGKLIGESQQNTWAILPTAVLGAALACLMLRRRALVEAAPALLVGLGAVALALLAIPVGQDFVLARNLLPALLPLLVAAAVALARFRAVGPLIAGLLCAYWLGFVIEADVQPDLQRPDWRAVATDLGPPTSHRALVTWTLGVAPLAYYLDDGTTKIRGGQPVRVRELDVISDTGAAAGIVPPSPAFRRVAFDTEGGLTLTRFVAPHRVGLSYRSLRGIPSGFDHNFVMVGKPRPGLRLRRRPAGVRTAKPGFGLPASPGPGASARKRFRECAAASSRSPRRRSLRRAERRARSRARARDRRRDAHSNPDSTFLRPRERRGHRAGRGHASAAGPGARGSGRRYRHRIRACLERGSA